MAESLLPIAGALHVRHAWAEAAAGKAGTEDMGMRRRGAARWMRRRRRRRTMGQGVD